MLGEICDGLAKVKEINLCDNTNPKSSFTSTIPAMQRHMSQLQDTQPWTVTEKRLTKCTNGSMFTGLSPKALEVVNQQYGEYTKPSQKRKVGTKLLPSSGYQNTTAYSYICLVRTPDTSSRQLHPLTLEPGQKVNTCPGQHFRYHRDETRKKAKMLNGEFPAP